jgi:arylsulfatase A-like enzyme
MDRRSFLHGATGSAMLAALHPWSVGKLSAARGPNIIFIITDDVSASLFNFHPAGWRGNLTPNLDRLAAEGTILWNQHISSPVCTPSRYSCLTGRYASRATNQDFVDTTARAGMSLVYWNTRITPDDLTFPKVLQDAGYITGMVGKNHTIAIPGGTRIASTADPHDSAVAEQLRRNKDATTTGIKAAGFDHAEGIYNGNIEGMNPPALRVHNMDWIAKAGLDFIDQNRGGPFFLYFATTLTHSPYERDQATEADPLATPFGYLAQAPGVLPSRSTLTPRLHAAGITPTIQQEMMLWLDDAIGALLAKLEQYQLLDDTIIIFFNDNGQEGKGSIYDSGVRCPSIVWRRNRFPCGPSSDALVSNIDFAPTICQLAGAIVPSGTFDGVSFLPVLEATRTSVHADLYFELGFTRGVRFDRWKYLALRYPPDAARFALKPQPAHMVGVKVPPGNPGFGHIGGNDNETAAMKTHPAYFDPDQLYDLRTDPDEQRNLANDPQYATKLDEMKQRLNVYLQSLPGGFAELKPS